MFLISMANLTSVIAIAVQTIKKILWHIPTQGSIPGQIL